MGEGQGVCEGPPGAVKPENRFIIVLLTYVYGIEWEKSKVDVKGLLKQ